MLSGFIGLIKIFVKLLLLLLLAIIVINFWVQLANKNRIYNDVSSIPYNKVGLVLGTSKFLYRGKINLFYQHRIDTAAALFHAKKVDYLLVSGDNSIATYNETKTMQQDLVAKGVPIDKVVLDYAGFRTLDSIVRAEKIFGQQRYTIISQQFHNERALFIADFYNLDTIAINAKDPGFNQLAIKVWGRERLARVKMLIDLWIGKSPKFLGNQIKIP